MPKKVARAHRGRQGRAQGLELGDASVGGVAHDAPVLHGAQGAFHPMAEMGDLEHPGQNRHQHAHEGQQQDGRPAPHHAIDGVVDPGERIPKPVRGGRFLRGQNSAQGGHTQQQGKQQQCRSFHGTFLSIARMRCSVSQAGPTVREIMAYCSIPLHQKQYIIYYFLTNVSNGAMMHPYFS